MSIAILVGMVDLIFPISVLENAQSSIGNVLQQISSLMILSSCRGFFKTMIFSIGQHLIHLVLNMFHPSEKRISGHHGFQESLALSGELR